VGYRLGELIDELDRQKRKYHEKLLSVDGEWTLVTRSLDTYDLAFDISYMIIPEYYYSSISAAFLFGFNLFEIEPLNIEFTWRYPTVEEWLNGVGIVIERIIPGYATTFDDFISTGVKEMYRGDITRIRVEKAVYDVSRYGEAYYDPPAVRELFRAALTSIFKKHISSATARAELKSLVRSLGINPDIAKSIYNTVSMHIYAHIGCFMLGYGVLGESFLCEEYRTHSSSHSNPGDPNGARLGKVLFEDYDGNVVEAGLAALSDLHTACVLGSSTLGACYLSDGKDLYVEQETVYTEAAEAKSRRFAERYMLTPTAFSNYVRGDEAADYHRCERTDIWGELMSIRYTVESSVDGLLAHEKPGLNPFDRRKYIAAALQLVGHIGKRHRWGYGAYKNMLDDELKTWWIDYWLKQGLDLNTLEKIFSLVRTWLTHITRIKVEKGESLRRRRLETALG